MLSFKTINDVKIAVPAFDKTFDKRALKLSKAAGSS